VTLRNVSQALFELVEPKAIVFTDQASWYNSVSHEFAAHSTVNHTKKEYVRGRVHTNTIEGFFGRFKRSLSGTYGSVSKKHLHRYVSEFEFRYNSRKLEDGHRVSLLIRKARGKRLFYREPVRDSATG
jgi:transposase-like protein